MHVSPSNFSTVLNRKKKHKYNRNFKLVLDSSKFINYPKCPRVYTTCTYYMENHVLTELAQRKQHVHITSCTSTHKIHCVYINR